VDKKRRVWVCEVTTKRSGRWVIWFADKHRASVLQSMRDGRAAFPKDEFRIVVYSP
jgi:hypothetical protein